jgi:hypothetical protein
MWRPRSRRRSGAYEWTNRRGCWVVGAKLDLHNALAGVERRDAPALERLTTAEIAGHPDARTTRPYVRKERKLAQAEVERVQL